jgi:hypothetical protein
MSVIYQVWWGRRTLGETFWFWGIFVGGVLIDLAYWVSFGLASASFPSIFGNMCTDPFENYSFYLYLVPAVAVKAWLGVGLVRSRTQVARPVSYVLKAAALVIVVAIVPALALIAYMLAIYIRAGCTA